MIADNRIHAWTLFNNMIFNIYLRDLDMAVRWEVGIVALMQRHCWNDGRIFSCIQAIPEGWSWDVAPRFRG